MTAELLACLTLVAPSNLSAEDRAAWIAVAKQTLGRPEAQRFREACQLARQTCRFPSEIVPTILGNNPDARKGGSRYISESGFIYKGDEGEVMRVAAQRADWTTYYLAKAALERPRLN